MDQPNGTPRSRPLLKFANRVYTSSPQTGTKRFGSPSAAGSSRRLFDRGALPPSSLDRSRMDAASNIFRASSLSTATTRFEPAIPSGTTRRLFAPAATPEPKKMQRSIKTPGGTKLKANEKDLFEMRIPSPAPELTGQALTERLPKDVDHHSHVYADQYAADLCPEGFTDEQRRQFFCILDLRRLKYAANEIFSRKDWRVNVMNFSKEYEKSRSLIMLRYGLYEFKNVKPSEDVLRKWRVAHGLEVEPTASEAPARKAEPPKGTKRKAEDELHPKDTALSTSSANPNKRKLTENEPTLAPSTTPNAKRPFFGRQSEPDENQPAAAQKPTAPPSITKSLFEKIAGGTNTPTKAKPSIFGSTLAPNPFAATAKPTPNGGASVFDKHTKQSMGSANIFGYLSDAGSPQNSGVDADGESETDSEQETEENVAASGGTNTPNVVPAAPSLFNVKKIGSSGLATGPSSTSSDAKESSNSLSLFDRVTKGNDGRPVRVQDEPVTEEAAAEEAKETPAKETPANKTWDPATPIKFAPSAPVATSIPGGTAANIFGQRPGVGSSIGSKKEDSSTPAASSQQSNAETDKSAGESDKENTAQPKSIFGASTTTPAPTSFGSSLCKPAERKDASGPAPLSAAASMFKAAAEKKDTPGSQPDGASSKSDSAKPPDAPAPSLFGTASSGASNMFGAKQPTPNGLVSQSSSLFGSKPPTNEAPAPSPFAQKPAETPADATKPTPNLFRPNSSATAFVASTEAPKSSIFGTTTPAAPQSNLFGSTAASTSAPTPSFFVSAPATTEADAPKPSSSLFGTSTTMAPSNSLFGQSKPALGGAPSFTFGAKPASEEKKPGADSKPANPLFGSPMKQDGPSPGKRSFGDAMQEDSPVRKKQFGQSSSSLFGAQNAAPSQPATSAPFAFGGGTPAAPAAPPAIFGSNGQPPKIDFNFGGASAPGAVASPFGGSTQPANGGFVFNASGNGTSNVTPAAGTNGGESNMFAFNASASTPQKGPGQRVIRKPNFGATKAAAQRAGLSSSMAPSPAPAQSGGSLFGNPGGASPAPSAPAFTFGGTPSTQPQQGQQGQQPGSLFGNQPQQGGNLFGGLQPTQGGASTTGTSMFPNGFGFGTR